VLHTVDLNFVASNKRTRSAQLAISQNWYQFLVVDCLCKLTKTEMRTVSAKWVYLTFHMRLLQKRPIIRLLGIWNHPNPYRSVASQTVEALHKSTPLNMWESPPVSREKWFLANKLDHKYWIWIRRTRSGRNRYVIEEYLSKFAKKFIWNYIVWSISTCASPVW
jgi:hypothetical protein